MEYMNRQLFSWTLFGRRSDKESRLRDSTALGPYLAFAFLLMQAPGALAQNTHTLPLFMSASDMARQGFVRIINRSERDGTVTIYAIDDSGDEAGPVTLSLGAKQTAHFNSGELELGAPNKGLSGKGVPPKLIIFNGFLVGAGAQHCQGQIRQRDRFATTMTIPTRNGDFGVTRAGSEWPARRAHSTACPNA